MSDCEYGVPDVPFGSEAVVTVRTGRTTIVRGCVLTCAGLFESVACAVKLYEPAVVGAPLIVAPNRVRPGGSGPVVIVQPTGAVPPVETSVWP
jgi:hypothetical protein